MKIVVKIVYIILSTLFLAYLALPTSSFPLPPKGALQSDEPADTETTLRRAYFTNYNREEVLNHYQEQFKKNILLNIKVITYRLNYPPEEAQTIIRDQTRSTFLEEIVHPLRESLFINGFEPSEPKDAIYISNKFWRQKITVRYVPSSIWTRLFIGILIVIILPILYIFLVLSLLNLKKEVLKWIYR
ncbi:MAG: hypothetical protein US60_C0055G0002 [Microgenomates group bacterium GW2011_GWC1_37_8]|nr:MAG: hypothetical protein US60_C0055G0002 [Microgenomates group bacterium GW2011_GWC1_37_8]